MSGPESILVLGAFLLASVGTGAGVAFDLPLLTVPAAVVAMTLLYVLVEHKEEES